MRKPTYLLLVLILIILRLEAFAITANPLISRGKSVYTSNGNAPYLVDNQFNGTTFSVNNNAWIAINLGKGPAKIFFTWNNPAYTWIQAPSNCTQSFSVPVNYTIQTSANSTNGNDGKWTTVTTITSNEATARGHAIDFTDAGWIRMSITSGGGSIDEVEAFDLSSGGTDLWFFPGTSISANTYKGTPPAKNYADLITAAHPGYTPAMVRAGVPCISSADLVNNLSKYIAMGGSAKYWAIEMGTNDGYNNGNSNVATFKTNLQKVIDACKTAGIEPVIARVLSTNQAVAGWQIHPDYLKAVDDLTAQNKLIAGPDFNAYFLAHPAELDPKDGIHPIATGAASIQKLWADKMASVYTNITAVNSVKSISGMLKIAPNPAVQGDVTISIVKVNTANLLQVFDIHGKEVFSQVTSAAEVHIDSLLVPGTYTVKLSNQEYTSTEKLVIH